MTQTPTGPAAAGTGQLDEAYQRLHATGPEIDGWLPNHGPMGAEAIVRHGHADRDLRAGRGRAPGRGPDRPVVRRPALPGSARFGTSRPG